MKDFKFHDFINTLEANVENNVFKQTYKTCIFYDMNKRLINDIDGKMDKAGGVFTGDITLNSKNETDSIA